MQDSRPGAPLPPESKLTWRPLLIQRPERRSPRLIRAIGGYLASKRRGDGQRVNSP
jgi:hypothetical protein